MTDDLVKRLTDHIAVFFDDKGHVFENEILCDEAADRIEELEAQLDAAESLRPIWAQGWTDDSQAAQVSSSALAQLWEMLGASNQTQAVEALAKLKLEAADRIEELEAKLAKAVEALERIVGGEFDGVLLLSLPPQDAAKSYAASILAKLKTGKQP